MIKRRLRKEEKNTTRPVVITLNLYIGTPYTTFRNTCEYTGAFMAKK